MSTLRLDCTSRQTTEQSLVTAFGCSVDDLRRFVADPSHAVDFEANWQHLPEFERWLFQSACEALGNPTLPTEFCWFHGTRVPVGTTFAEGILPLGAWLPVFEERWKPAMVKFVGPAGESAPYALATALCYLRECALKGHPGYGAVWCFDGANEALPAEPILGVDWV